MRQILLIIYAFCVVLAAPSYAQSGEMELLDNERPLRIGERMTYYVIEEREPPIKVYVNNDGYVKVPYIGDVYAKGKTARQLAYETKNKLEVDFFHQATVHISRKLGDNIKGEVTILGEINQQGKHKIPADKIFYVSDAIIESANGFTKQADQRQVTVVRQDPSNPEAEIRFIVDVGGIISTGEYRYDMPVEPDDLIIVPKLEGTGGFVYVDGEVRSPGQYPIPPTGNFTVSQAILAAGGFTSWAKEDKVKLIRPGNEDNEEQRTIRVNVQDIFERNIREFDPTVRPGDVIRVEETFIRF